MVKRMGDFEVGRPSIFDWEKANKILGKIANNVPDEKAAVAGRICPKTFHNWIKKGKEALKNGETNDFTEFFWKVLETKVKKLEEHLKEIESCKKGWQARAWLLQRVYPEIYGDHAFQLKEFEERLARLELEKLQPQALTDES